MICLCANTHAILSSTVPDSAATPIVQLFRHFVTFLMLCGIDVISGVSLFGSKPLLDHFGIGAPASKWRSFLSVLFLLASFLLILWIVDFFDRKVLDRWEDR